ncbi:hypothetical protein FRC07_012371, partial [Ceratobasidium sp. 392]
MHVYETSAWRLIDHVSSPASGRHTLITTLKFWRDTFEGYWLFIGHAKAGFCLWYGPGKYRRVPYGDGLASSIGSATVSNDRKFIAVVTLDHSVVLYPLHRSGPVIDRQQTIPNQEQAGYRPIVPIALVSDKLVLRGSTSGDVPIFDIRGGPLAPIRNDSLQVVRALATYDDLVIVGLSHTTGTASEIKCYSNQPSSILSSAPWIRLDNTDGPLFRAAIDDLEGPTSAPGRLIRNFGNGIISRLRLFVKPFFWLFAVVRCRQTWILMSLIWAFSMLLVIDPPSLPSTPGPHASQNGYKN